MIKLALRRPVLTIVVFLAVVFTGVIAFQQLSLSLFPSFDYPELTVVTEYPGATSIEVEEYVTRNLEQAVSGVVGVRTVHGISRENLSVLRLQFDWGTNMEYATLNTREKLDAARMMAGFPEDADRPTILKWNPASAPVMGVFVTGGETTAQLTEFLETVIRQRLEGIDGVSAVQLKGGRDREVAVLFDPRKLMFYNLSQDRIGAAIQDYNLNQVGGVIRKGNYRYSLRIVSGLKTLDDISSIPVAKLGTAIVRVRDVADVRWEGADITAVARMNGRGGVLLLVYKTVSANTLDTIEQVRIGIRELSAEFPGYRFDVAFENGRIIRLAIQNVVQTILWGGLLAFLVIVLFLGNFRAPLVISVSIPVSILGTFAWMYFLKVNLNIMSLSGLALAVGMLVDNGIVVLESIVRRHDSGDTDAAAIGTRDVAGAVLASTLTTVAVFLPLMFVHGVAGHLFRDQSLTVTVSLLFSYFVSVTLLPVTARWLFASARSTSPDWHPTRPEVPSWKRGLLLFPWYAAGYLGWFSMWLVASLSWIIGRILSYLARLLGLLLQPVLNGFEKGYQGVFSSYHRLLKVLLDRKAMMFSIATLLLAAGILGGFHLRRELFPKTRAEYLRFKVMLPRNVSIFAAERFTGGLEQFLKKDNSVGQLLMVVGVDPTDLTAVTENSGPNTINTTVQLKGDETALRRRIIGYFEHQPAARLMFEKGQDEFSMVMRTGALKVKFQAAKRRDAIALAMKVRKALAKDSRVGGVTDNASRNGVQVTEIRFRQDELLKYGISANSLGEFLTTTIRGKVPSLLRLTDRNYSIRVRMDKKDRARLDDILQTPFLKGDLHLKVGELVNVSDAVIPDLLEREQQNPMAELTVALVPGANPEEVLKDTLATAARLKGNMPVVVTEGREMREMHQSLQSLIAVLLLSFVLVYLLLSAQFESFKIPFIIIFTYPMGLAGAFLGLILTGMTLNVLSAIGLVILTGVVVNDAIVKVDCIHQKTVAGISVRQSIMKASEERFRPIWMTTITTVLGLAPVFVISGAGSDLLKPLAVTLIFGLTVATTLTLFLIPGIYEAMGGKERREGVFTAEDAEGEEEDRERGEEKNK